jgi:protein-arginine kinase activator protein McsA
VKNLTPTNFTVPHELEVLKLEQEYSRAIREEKGFEEIKAIRKKIKLLKSELEMQRKQLG